MKIKVEGWPLPLTKVLDKDPDPPEILHVQMCGHNLVRNSVFLQLGWRKTVATAGAA
jgi:hypothetical protein